MRNYIFFMMLVFCVATVQAQTEPANYNVAANKFKQFYNSNRPDSIFNIFNSDAKAMLPLDKWTTIITQLKTQYGDLNTVKFATYAAPVAVYEATFQKAVLMLNMQLDNTNKLSGLRFTPQPAKADEAPMPV